MGVAGMRSERGAITIHVALALIALLAFSSLVIDYGVMWVSRRQAQNAADAGALAGAVALARDGGGTAAAKLSAEALAANNMIWGQANVAGSGGNIIVAASGTGAGEDATIQPCLSQTGCVRVDVLRNEPPRGGGAPVGAPLPTFFANIVGIGAQGVRATATAQVRPGNQVRCMLPFAVFDRWADNADPTPVTTFFPNDGATGTAGWSPNDSYEPGAGVPGVDDEYVPPYGSNAGHTGWRLNVDYGRQLVLKDGAPGLYPAGWTNLVYLPGSTTPADIRLDIIGSSGSCNNPTVVGVATPGCTDTEHGCISLSPGIALSEVQQGITDLVALDGAANWNPSAPGPTAQPGAVVGGSAMDSPRIRPLAVLDIGDFVASGCAGSNCPAKVANIVGFFVEGLCGSVVLDPGLTCTAGDIVGRMMTIPGKFASGTGTVDDTASFVRVVQLVR